MTTLPTEIYWLGLSALLTSVLWVPHIGQRILEMGPYAALRDPRHDVPTSADWAQRAIKAHTNAVENLTVMSVLVLALVFIGGAGNQITALAVQVFFFVRLAHYVVYVLGLPWLRTPLFLVGFVCQLIVGAVLFGM